MKMKLFICILPLLFSLALGQFGGFGGFANRGSSSFSNLQQGFGSIASSFKSVPFVDNARDFGDFAVS